MAKTRRALEADAAGKPYEPVDIEEAVDSLLTQIAPLLVQHVAEAVDGGRVRNEQVCPTCGGPLSFVQKCHRTLVFLFGPVRVKRARFHCKRCHKGRAPLEHVWGLQTGACAMGKRLLTPRAQLELITLCASGAYEKAREHFVRMTGVAVSAMTGWRYTQRLGAWLRAKEGDGCQAVPFREGCQAR